MSGFLSILLLDYTRYTIVERGKKYGYNGTEIIKKNGKQYIRCS